MIDPMRSARQIVSIILAMVFVAFMVGHAWASDGNGTESSALKGYYAGNGLLQRNLYDLAAEEYRGFLREHGDHEKAPAARYGLAVSLFRTNKFEDARKELALLADVRDFQFAADVLTMQGQCLMANKEYAEAAKGFEKVLEKWGDHKLAVEAGAQLVEAYYRSGKFDQALAAASKTAARWPTAPQLERVELFAALAEISQNHFAKAATHAEALKKAFPKGTSNQQATLLLAQCRQRLNQLDEAAADYREILKDESSRLRPDALWGATTILLQKQQAKVAGAMLDELIQKYATSPLIGVAWFQRGRAWFEMKSYDEAAKCFKRSLEAAPESADEATYWLAKCELRRGDFKAAGRRLNQAIKAYPQSKLQAEMAFDRIVALLRSGERDEATKELEAFCTTRQDHALAAEALELWATTLHQAAKYDQSRKRCHEFLGKYASHSRTASVTFLSAENCFLAHQFLDASQEYRNFLEQFPRDELAGTARHRLGMSLYFLGKPKEAEPLLAESAQKAESDERMRPAVLALGNLYFDRSDWKNAEGQYSKYLSFRDGAAEADEAELKLGLCLERQEKYAEALKCFDRLIGGSEKSPHRVQAIFERGQTLLALKRTRQAAEAFEQVLATDANGRFAPYAKSRLGTISLQNGDFRRAEKMLDAATGEGSSPELKAEAMFDRGLALEASQDHKAAERVFAEFLREFPHDARAAAASARRAIALARQDRREEALRAFDELAFDKLDDSLRSTVTYEQAWCLRELGRNEDAAKACRKLVDENKNDPIHLHAMLELSRLEFDAKRFESAAALLTRIEKIVKDDPTVGDAAITEQAEYRLGLTQFELGQIKNAAQKLADFARRFPKSKLLTSACYYAGEANFRLGKHEDAVQCFQQAMAADGAESIMPVALLRSGEALAQMQRWPKSEAVFAKYLDRFPNAEGWFQAAFGVGWARENQGRHHEAIESYRRVVDKHKGPTAARAQFQIGECLFAKKQYDAAVRELMKVDVLYDYPEWSAAALYEAGRCFEKLSKSAEARQQFQRVAEKHRDTQWGPLAQKRLDELVKVARAGQASD